MEFKKENEELSFIEQQFSSEPCINVITKEMFEERVYKVFSIIWEKLSKSFGPGGSGTFISVYPAYYNTKDGFTIMKNIAFDKKLDQVICDMVMDICSRLNFTVGDGTTTAVIATKSAYEAYVEVKDYFTENNILPRDILKKFDKIKEEVLKEIDSLSVPIRSDDSKELRRNIEKVVYISSNGNEEITNMIGSLYEELMFPAITCTTAKDGVMKYSIVDGFKSDITLTDKLYINNDTNSMIINNGADVILFDHKVTRDTYELILKPLSEGCRGRGRHLICVAPFYDEIALSGIIQQDLMNEYRKTKDVNLVLTCCKKPNGPARVSLEDLAMLLNTSVVTPTMENEYLEALNQNESVYKFFDLDNRGIEGITVCVANKDTQTLHPVIYTNGLEDIFDYYDAERGIRVGYCNKLEIGLADSSFAGFYYDENLYNVTLNTAKSELAEIQKKCEKIGTFSIELINKQKRVYSLGLKTGVIEVAADTELVQGYLKDTIDDAVKAAASAYNNGVVLGCNVSLSKALLNIYENTEDELTKKISEVLLTGFSKVYSTVLANRFNDIPVYSSFAETMMSYVDSNFNLPDKMDSDINITEDDTIYSVIKYLSIKNSMVYDVSENKFSKEIINSAETDKEILKAVIDLLSLLITGNQMVLR